MDKAWHEQPRDFTDRSGVTTETNKYPQTLFVLSLMCLLWFSVYQLVLVNVEYRWRRRGGGEMKWGDNTCLLISVGVNLPDDGGGEKGEGEQLAGRIW